MHDGGVKMTRSHSLSPPRGVMLLANVLQRWRLLLPGLLPLLPINPARLHDVTAAAAAVDSRTLEETNEEQKLTIMPQHFMPCVYSVFLMRDHRRRSRLVDPALWHVIFTFVLPPMNYIELYSDNEIKRVLSDEQIHLVEKLFMHKIKLCVLYLLFYFFFQILLIVKVDSVSRSSSPR